MLNKLLICISNSQQNTQANFIHKTSSSCENSQLEIFFIFSTCDKFTGQIMWSTSPQAVYQAQHYGLCLDLSQVSFICCQSTLVALRATCPWQPQRGRTGWSPAQLEAFFNVGSTPASNSLEQAVIYLALLCSDHHMKSTANSNCRCSLWLFR